MISIGKNITIYEEGNRTAGVQIYFKGHLLGTVKALKLDWNSNSEYAIKHCSLASLSSTDFDPLMEAVAFEFMNNGFWVEVNYPVTGTIVEFYEGKREEKVCKK